MGLKPSGENEFTSTPRSKISFTDWKEIDKSVLHWKSISQREFLNVNFISRHKERRVFRHQTFKSPVAAALVKSPPSAILFLFLLRKTADQNHCRTPWVHPLTGSAAWLGIRFSICSSRENMASTLEQLKKYTTVVADSGDFESKKETVCWCLCCFVCIAHFPCVRSCFSYLAVQTYRCNHQPFLALGCLQNATVSAFAGESCAVWKIQWKVQGIVCFKQFLKKFDALSACQSSI